MKRLLLPLLGGATLLAATAVNAQTLTAPTVSATVGQQDLAYTITYTPGANSGGFDFVATYDSTEPASVTTTVGGAGANDVTEAVANGAISCSTTATTISCIANANDTSTDLGTGTITILFDVGPTTGTAPITFTSANFFDQDGNPENGTTVDGAVNIQAGPTAPQLTFNPAPGGTVTLNAGGAGTVAVTAGAGSAGETATLTCSSDNGTATVTGSPFAPDSTGTINVQCTPVVGATDPFTVTCTVDQSVGTDQGQVTFTGTCPAITPSPEFSANLNVALTGAPGTTLTGGSTISNTGNAPLTVGPCTVTGDFTVTPPGPIAAGGTGTLGVSCVAPASAGAIATGTAVCTTDDPDDGEGSVTFTLSCGAQVLAVPAMGSFGKGILAALLAGLGLLVFAMRRRASV